MPVARVFSACVGCGHASVAREGAACLACGAETRPAAPPERLFDGWRCMCYHCTSTPC